MAGRRPRYLAAISTAFLASLLSMAMGLALGGEAPSSYMGGAIFSAVHLLSFRRDPSRGSAEAEEALTLGAGVGFGLAFQNPLAGALLSLGDDP